MFIYIPPLSTLAKNSYSVPNKTIKAIHDVFKQLDEIPLCAWSHLEVEQWADHLCVYHDQRLRIFKAEKNRSKQMDEDPEYAFRRRASKMSSEGRYRGRAARSKRMAQAAPAWANLDTIAALYKQCYERTRSTGVKHHVDHVIPLVGKWNGVHVVCGLHCEANLTISTASDNLKKGCFFNPNEYQHTLV